MPKKGEKWTPESLSERSQRWKQNKPYVLPEKKRCSQCKIEKPITEFGLRTNGVYVRSRCKGCENDNSRTWGRRNRERVKETNYRAAIERMGLTVEEYNALAEAQGNVCAICKQPQQEDWRSERLCIDHNHTTGKNRGLLCNTCNRGIGLLKDNPILLRAAADYIEQRN